ncbi:MAG: M20/M25/M40 family metallo-hydrolase [Actinobacteria bacterium]|nr:M20/M25/M40 family metallo-hydrolase [Actinomycetota bacterium]MBU1494651.1 M20/M25/M40 family metallo-hydrolase [Actinomycetota bacterium]
MAKKTTQIGWIAGAGMGAAAAAALRRRWGRPQGSSDESRDPDRAATDAGERFLDHLAEAIRIPTVAYEDRSLTDTGQFDRMHALLAEAYPLVHQRLERETVAGHSALYTWRGSEPDLAPILLMAHIDVVPVESGTEDAWEEGPFSGVRSGGYLWGRGAVDDKCAVIGLFEAVETLLAEGFEPVETVYLSIGHDEEIGGGEGAAAVAALLTERGVHVEFVLDEGGAIALDLLPGITEPVALLGIGEKGYLNVELTATESGGHSSVPPRSTAVGKIAAAIIALEANPMPARLSVQKPFFGAIASVLPWAQAMAIRNADRLAPLLVRRLETTPATNALIRTTTAVTMVEGGVKPNILPQKARAVVNFRILPGDAPGDVLAHVRSVVGPEVSVAPLEGGFAADPSPLSDIGSVAFGLIADTIAEVFPGVAVAPWILMGATDSRYFAPIADNVYRFAPFTASPADMTRIHGTGERFPIDDADRVVEFFQRLIRRAAG